MSSLPKKEEKSEEDRFLDRYVQISVRGDGSDEVSIRKTAFLKEKLIDRLFSILLTRQEKIGRPIHCLNLTNFNVIPDQVGCFTLVKQLMIYFCPIKTLPATLSHLVNLETFIVTNTEVTTIPAFIERLPALKNLRITDSQVEEIPDFIRSMTQLQSFQVGMNRIRQVPDLGNLIQLRNLDLAGADLTEIPGWIQQLSLLERLELTCNRIKQIPDWFACLEKLKMIDLCQNQICQVPESINRLLHLEIFDLNRNLLTEVPKLTNPNLKVLAYEDNIGVNGIIDDKFEPISGIEQIKEALPLISSEEMIRKIVTDGFYRQDQLDEGLRNLLLF